MSNKCFFRPIGEEFKYGSVTLRVVKDEYPYCTGCFFGASARCLERDFKITGRCTPDFITEAWTKFVKVEGGKE